MFKDANNRAELLRALLWDWKSLNRIVHADLAQRTVDADHGGIRCLQFHTEPDNDGVDIRVEYLASGELYALCSCFYEAPGIRAADSWHFKGWDEFLTRLYASIAAAAIGLVVSHKRAIVMISD